MCKLSNGLQMSRIRTHRAATIPYIITQGKNGRMTVKFLLARDRKTGDITDLGGGVKQDEFSLIAAIREFQEETNGIFGDLYNQINSFSRYISLIGKNMSTIFIPVNERWFNLAVRKFQNKINKYPPYKKAHQEISELIWFSEYNFKRLIYGESCYSGVLWKRLKKFYRYGYNKNFLLSLETIYNSF